IGQDGMVRENRAADRLGKLPRHSEQYPGLPDHLVRVAVEPPFLRGLVHVLGIGQDSTGGDNSSVATRDPQIDAISASNLVLVLPDRPVKLSEMLEGLSQVVDLRVCLEDPGSAGSWHRDCRGITAHENPYQVEVPKFGEPTEVGSSYPNLPSKNWAGN